MLKSINIFGISVYCFWSTILCTDATLKNVFKDDFLIGTAVSIEQFYEQDIQQTNLIHTHFNSITSENTLKWEMIHPLANEYTFEASDQFVLFGEKHQMVIIGHALIWHQQTPAWVFEDEQGNTVDRDTLLKRMRNHIHTLVDRYKDRIHGWDVVNEALNEDGTMRASPWMKIIGEDYVIKAFQFAHEADPNAELYYNDYDLHNPLKRAGAVALIHKLQEHHLSIKAIGLQEHNTLDWPLIQDIEETIMTFAELSIKVNITELDVDVLPQAWHLQNMHVSNEMQDSLNPYAKELPDSVNQALSKRYAELFNVYLKYSPIIERITFWGLTDRNSWLNDIPIKGRTNYPLLFDRQGQSKSVFNAVISLKKQ